MIKIIRIIIHKNRIIKNHQMHKKDKIKANKKIIHN